MITTCGEGFQIGESVCVSIRPEYLNVSREPKAGFTIRARVKDFIYMGTVLKTSLDLPSGQELKFSRFEVDPDLKEGDERFLWWDPVKSVPIHLEPQEVHS
jgi:spermidine/putrescine transport system ATP-binding protein